MYYQVHRIVNLPMDTTAAWKIIESLHIDVLLFPDYQPFPDQQSVLFQSRRIAPVQVIHPLPLLATPLAPCPLFLPPPLSPLPCTYTSCLLTSY